ncbi:kinase-like domain-containing protein [Suillus fuscotomentosus]|uniref:Kinase-like domain-containing protein n=1 Tax=Suillus fuscotomentosus TaxID=1912939 RepID=A0AAD4E9X2_9AGAM|nr:kinase-like domain-containing protein [Suillus fuscotomentosus]KAG1902270.1 kinase-like domain-containing protein [Suillus fuscotomentosus]
MSGNAIAMQMVAVKAFRYPENYYDSERIYRKISREIGILTLLRHDNIVPLLGIATGFGRRPDLPSLVTPWIPNGTLNVYLVSRHNDLTVLDRSRMLEDVSAGLRYLHSVPVVHGDITGANILIDEGGRAKLIDFGLSAVVLPLFGQSHLAATSIHAGAIHYAAPELLLDDVDVNDPASERTNIFPPLEKTDIYSFGCVMLQILSGRYPWFEIKSQNPEFRIYGLKRQGRGPQRPNGHPAIMDSDWDMIQKCLQLKFELRPSADEVSDFITRRSCSSDSSSLPNDFPDDAQGGFRGVFPRNDSSGITKHLLNSPRPHPDHEPTNGIIEPGAQISFSSSPANTDSWPLFPSISTDPTTAFDSDFLRYTSNPGHEQKQSVTSPPPNAWSSNHKTRLRESNVVIFGETGSGKSSIINTIAQEQLAKTSNDAHGCTSTSQRYPVEISGQRFVLIDTAGLCMGTADSVSAAKAEKKLKSLLREFMNSKLDGISLLVYCMDNTIAPSALVKAYDKFYSGICQKKVPIVVVVTGLEKETHMENWWDTNVEKFKGMSFADHACVTTLWEHSSFPDHVTHRILESGNILRKLVVENCADLPVPNGSDSAAGTSWLKKIGKKG